MATPYSTRHSAAFSRHAIAIALTPPSLSALILEFKLEHSSLRTAHTDTARPVDVAVRDRLRRRCVRISPLKK